MPDLSKLHTDDASCVLMRMTMIAQATEGSGRDRPDEIKAL